MKQGKQELATTRRFQRHWAAALAGGLALAGAASSTPAATAAPTQYRVVNLGPGDVGIAVNAKGQVAFTHADPWAGPPEAWFYDGARLRRLGTLGGAVVRTTGVNDAGQVTGISDNASGLIRSFVWSRQRGMIDIGGLPARPSTWDPVINNRGEVTGYATADPSPPYPHAFRWSAASGIEDLGLLLPGDDSSSYGRAINDAGLIAGDAWAGGSNYHAFVWSRAGGMVDIDTLGSHASTPVAVGAAGQVAGNRMNPPDNAGSVFRWTRTTGMRDLGTGGGQGTWMVGMSSGGRIYGVITFADYSQHAMTWTLEHGMRDLGTLGGRGSNANAANNLGQVVGGATTADDRYHAFLWSGKEGMVDLNRRLVHAPAGLELNSAVAISDSGAIVAASNAGLVLLKPVQSCNCGHAAGPIASPDVVAPGAAVDASIGIAAGDAAGAGSYKVSWAWGDGTAERARDAAAGPAKAKDGAQARHSYAAPGIYTITADVDDGAGNRASVSRRIVVVEPSGGAIGGAGSVVLPTSTSRRFTVAGGKAYFGFVTAPAAKTGDAKGQLFFALPGFAFASDDVHVSALQGTRAQLAGTGALNGAGGYRFTASAAAGAGGGAQAGRFGVKIWHTDPKTGADVVDYDSHDGAANAGNAGERPLAEGRIVAQ